MKITKFKVLAVAAVLIVLGVNHFDDPEREKELNAQMGNTHYITKAEAAVLWDSTWNKTKEITQEAKSKLGQLAKQENQGMEDLMAGNFKSETNTEKKIVKAEFNPIPANDEPKDDGHYITKAEAEVLLDRTVKKVKETTDKVKKFVTDKMNSDGEAQLKQAGITPFITKDEFIKGKDKTIDAMIDALEKMRSEPRTTNKENKHK